MPVLVTGGLGHIGSWVCHELVKRGQSVIVTGRSHRRVSYLEGMEKQIKFVPADVVDQASIYRLFAEQKGAIEGVVHIAGLMGGPFFASNPRHHVHQHDGHRGYVGGLARLRSAAVCLYQLRRGVRGS